MPVIRITKEFCFEMAHALLHYEGDCRNIHGHSYKMEVTLKGVVQHKEGHQQGMVTDFAILKKIVQKGVLEIFDHALVLHEQAPEGLLWQLKAHFPKIVVLSNTPTCENLIVHFYYLIRQELPNNMTLERIKLRETETSYAEYYASDN